ncbi:hypothetical protein MTR67_038581 [Solanum verrucosum]|uniref:Integrase catalytic domain-containing protein n=1 Tax=Solanum verrucosum TaxID=315347 RepID=A0AAF0ZN11_SOLVR|nr:hypothetical protein MTR67_038581 [Solanum verrucosum]
MNFIVGVPRTRRQHDSIWVIVDRIRKSAHFIPVKVSFSEEGYAKLYLRKIRGLGTHVKLSTIFHPQTDGLAECIIQNFKYMLRAYVIDFKGNLDDHLPLIEFVYNNSYHSIIMTPFEALYGRRCRSHIDWFEVSEVALIGPELVHEAVEKDWLSIKRLKTTKSRQKSYADVRRRDLEFDINDWAT